MAAAEISYDKDWIRYRVSAFALRAIRIHAMDAPVGSIPSWIFRTLPAGFSASGIGKAFDFSAPAFFSHSRQPHSIASLQQRRGTGRIFVNPGIFLANAGADFDITPKLRGFANLNFLPLERAPSDS